MPKIYVDNQGTIALARNPVKRQSSKHVHIKYHFVRSIINDRKMILEYCPATEHMGANVMTKPATKFKLNSFEIYIFGE